jgi:uncharacterized protein
MRFKINEIGDEGLALDVPITADWLAASCPDLEARPGMGGLKLRGRLMKSGEDYLLQGSVRGVMETTCARCLEPARVKLDVPVAVNFVPADEDDDELDGETDVVGFQGGQIDVSEPVRDEILLALPVKPLCADACKGLCAVCGGNRNATPCDCEELQRQSGSRFAASLGKLKI